MVLLLVSSGLTHGAAFSWGLSWGIQDGPTLVSGIGADCWLGHLRFPTHGLSSPSELKLASFRGSFRAAFQEGARLLDG